MKKNTTLTSQQPQTIQLKITIFFNNLKIFFNENIFLHNFIDIRHSFDA